MMEVEKPWEFKEEVRIMEEEEEEEDSSAAAGGLQTRERKNKKTAGDNGDHESLLNLKAAEEEEEEGQQQHRSSSIFFDPTNGLWKCRHCDWTYQLSGPCTDDILNHQGYCQIARNLESLVHHEPFYYSPGKVSDHTTEMGAEDEVTEILPVGGQKENSNGTSIPEGKENEEQENVNVQETNHNASNGKLENGSYSNGVHEISSSSKTVTVAEGEALIATTGESKNILPDWSGGISSGSTGRTEVHEIEVQTDEDANKVKVNIEEYDLERILDEQETHDLYCPNCNSCITRRVILKKRKRTMRQAHGDGPPKRPHAEPSAIVSDQSPAVRQDQESLDVFRCLSCFTFFIPTGCGFNIFRIFRRRDAIQQPQVEHSSASYDTSENCGSWLLSCFQTVDSPKKSPDADPLKEPLLNDSRSTNDKTSAEANTSSVHSHATISKGEQLKKPLPAGSSSIVQTANAENEDVIKQSFSEFHGSASSSESVQTPSFTNGKISSWQSETGFTQTEVGHVVAVQPGGARQEQIPLSKPAGDTLTDAIQLGHEEDTQGNTAAASGNSLFFNQAISNSELKVPTASPIKILSDIRVNTAAASENSSFSSQATFKSELRLPEKVSSEVNNLPREQPTSAIPEPVQSSPHVALSVPDAADLLAPTQRDEWDILKAIVYGGLVESITSLSVVSAAAASGAKTLDIFILGIANLIGGLPIIYHNVADLREIGDENANNERAGHYWLHLGRRSKYRLHMAIAILSYILFGLLPPVAYGFSFRKSDDREKKMAVVAAASLVCIALLAIGKAHVSVRRPRAYITTLLYYLAMGFSCSGLSYVAGVLITRLLAHLGLIDQGPSLLLPVPDAAAMGATLLSF